MLLTVRAVDAIKAPTAVGEVEADVADVALVTSTLTSVTHTAPLLPQDFTCTVCSPVDVEMLALMEVA